MLPAPSFLKMALSSHRLSYLTLKSLIVSKLTFRSVVDVPSRELNTKASRPELPSVTSACSAAR